MARLFLSLLQLRSPTAGSLEMIDGAHRLTCGQMKVKGMDTKLDSLICPFASTDFTPEDQQTFPIEPRNRWSLSLLIGLLLICLAVLWAYVFDGALKGYVRRWLKDDDIGGAVGGGHIVLLYPPDSDQTLPGLVCRLGSSMSSLGFSVSLDLWSQAELSVLGPVPWLHSRLDCLQRQGGKVVLVLTQAGAASQPLAGGLREFAGGSAVLRLAGLPQDCVGAVVQEPCESVPLQTCLTTPTFSPDTCTKTSGMDWV